MRALAVLLALGLLTGCERSDPAPAEAPAPRTVSGVGTVIGVDPPNGTVTLQHGPIPEIGWPAMRMAFTASPQIVAAARVGDRVAFDLKLAPGGGEITALRKL
jgi:Cu/Ag efflux protein CusF